MKKLLFIALLAAPIVGTLSAVTAQDVEQYIKMEKAHKAKWFDFKRDHMSAEFDLLKKHHNEKADLKIQHIEQMAANKDMNQMFADKLKGAIALHEKQMEEWQQFCKTWEDKARAQSEAEKAELAKFKESVFPTPKKESAEVEMAEETMVE
jgi:hypothetical protein